MNLGAWNYGLAAKTKMVSSLWCELCYLPIIVNNHDAQSSEFNGCIQSSLAPNLASFASRCAVISWSIPSTRINFPLASRVVRAWLRIQMQVPSGRITLRSFSTSFTPASKDATRAIAMERSSGCNNARNFSKLGSTVDGSTPKSSNSASDHQTLFRYWLPTPTA